MRRTQPSLKPIIITALQQLMHQLGIEPGSVPWQGTILPLDHWCFDEQIIKHILFYL
ncbi:hypothetical protein BRARA_D01817 [Brassica rapa]|uniref:Uncharacterized protein n=1 Tax=Brassica campestris TaxID=3711 RepID=A0A397ZUW0_BRACM|nr:hypothetical protein BRARA_D01817 [Brassica rapa]